MLNYHHLRYFWIVAHEGNLTRAAKKISIAQSALSMQISALEKYLGQDLFERTGRSLVLTEAGQVALDFADSIFTTGEELLGTLSELEDPQEKILRVGAIATLSRNFQIQFLEPILTKEGASVTIRSGALYDLLESLEAYQLDVVLSTVAPVRDESTRWVAHAIDKQPVSLIGQAGKGYENHSVKYLLQHEPLILPAKQSSIRSGFDALITRLRIQPNIVAEVDDMAMLRLVARTHVGLSVVPPIVVKDELDMGTLVEIAALPDLDETFFAITLARRFPNPLLNVVLPKDLTDAT